VNFWVFTDMIGDLLIKKENIKGK